MMVLYEHGDYVYRILRKLWHLADFSVYSTLQHRLHVAVTLVLFRCLVVSISGEMALMCELLNNADFPSCYVIKTFVTSSSKCADKNATALPRPGMPELNCPPTINLSPATSFLGESPAYIERGRRIYLRLARKPSHE